MTKRLQDKIDTSQKVLLQCHKNPDPDSIGCALAWHEVLTKLGKEVEIICPNSLSQGMKDLFPEAEKLIKQNTNFQTFNFETFDLFILNDTASTSQLANNKELELPNDVEIFVIDHHKSNDLEVENKIVQGSTFANAQILYGLFVELGYEITSLIATYMYAGMLTDTYNFMYAPLDSNFFATLSKVIENGANVKHIIDTLHMSNSLNEINAMGYIMNEIKVEEGKNNKFAWVYFDHAEMEKFNISYHDLKDKLADEVINTIADTDFGIVIYKLKPESGDYYLSIRARSDDFDSAKLATTFGGGGHKSRAGANLIGIDLNKIIEDIKQL